MTNPQPRPRDFFLAGVSAGLVVGLVEGLRSGILAQLDAAGLLACVLLVTGLHLLTGAVLGAAGAGLAAAWRWGQARPGSRTGWVIGHLAAGALSAAAVAGAVSATAFRNNRFLAGGIAALAGLVAGGLGLFLAPALTRLLAFGKGLRTADPARGFSPFGLWVAAPLAGLGLAAGVFVQVARVTAPLRGTRLRTLVLGAAAVGLFIPLAMALAGGLARRVRRRWAVTAAVLLFVAPAVGLLLWRWNRDFQFVRWNDVLALVAIFLLALVAGLPLARRWRTRGALVAGLVLAAGGIVLPLVAGESEPARKAAVTRAGLASPWLAGARLALDRDRDGYTSLLGGGDCRDGDAEVNPGAQEWPDDGIDQNCDGKDASTTAVRALPFHPVPAAVPENLNVLFVTVDTLRADHLGTYGYQRPTSPVLDALGAAGTVFENGWAHAPSTRYSMPALATGRWPSTISWEDCAGCDRFWPRIGRGQKTLGEAMKESGYFTGAFYAFSYFAREYRRGFERGIDDYQDRRAALHTDVNGPMESSGSSAREIADDAIAFLEQRQAQPGGKWFLWLHFYDPHLDYQRHAGAPDFGKSQMDLYDGEIWFTDQQLGRVFDRLKTLGAWDRTAIVVTGDHGEGFGERGIAAHGYHLYAPQTKVPFLVRVPGLSPRRVPVPVSHVDLAPTLLNLARGKPEKSFLGRSMVDLLAGSPNAEVPTAPVFQEVTYEGPTHPTEGTKRRGLVTADHHVIWNWLPDNTTECYDRRVDPRELRDLWGSAAGAACVPLKSSLQDLVQTFSWPLDLAEKLANGVSSDAGRAPAPTHKADARLGTAVRFVGHD
ncbi:MAG TPA: sulfatase-like hydrolase/transferase, partial [Polyangia bacterium]